MPNRVEQFADPLEVSKFASLPEQEWRVEITKLVLNLRDRVDENTDITADTQEGVNRELSEIKAILTTVKGGLAFLGGMGKAVKWFTIMAGGFVAFIAALKAAENIPQLIEYFFHSPKGPK